jgi:glycosyltransferase involved in cell wall biosynthesis
VRSGPGLDRLKITAGNDKYKKGKKYLIGYVGVIGEQEGLDLLLDSAQYIAEKRNDVQFAIVGGGTDLEKIKTLSDEMGLINYVDFYGRVSDEVLVDVLNTADVCVNPDKPTEMNNLSTMNKIMEYMALKKPVVQYDLKEGKFSAQKASLYAENTSTEDFAEKILYLLNNEKVRKEMGEYGYQRVLKELSWDHESKRLVDFYIKALKIRSF